MSHGKMPLVLSLVLILCGLFNSISCEKQQTSPKTITPVSFKRIAALSQKMEANYKAFAQELFKTLLIEDPRKNMIFSPVSISISLATLSLGLRSATRTKAIDVLERDLRNLRVWDKHQALQHLVEMLHELEKKKQLKHKDIFFIDRNKKMNQMFLKEIDRVYKVDIQMIDFKDKEKTKKAINQFVADKIDKKAKNLITHLDPQTLLCLVNYIFFKGILERAFQTNLTKKEDFFVNEKTIVQVDMMRKTERMIYSRSEELLATMVKMPCKENASIILVLPDTGKFDFALKEMAAKRARLQKTNDFRLVHLVVPKIKITSKIDLKHLLPKIGINDIFTTKAVTWNTTKTSTILEAVHHAVIEVKEDGLTKNAAKDKDFWKVPVDKKEVPVVVKFDRPFFLFVEDEITRRDLFVAKVFNPKTE
uniref:Uteroferrin associated basic protein-2 n=1 Tax=Sus scrofa TaxID=9823 RepID=A0A8D1W1Z9_PIG